MPDLKHLGWFRFYRSTQYNRIWKRDHSAWRVFEGLMMLCDRQTGRWEGGRFQLAEFCGLNPNTTYSAIKRLEKEEMLTLSSNNRFTTFYICNWIEYQTHDNTPSQQLDNNSSTTGQHSNKKKELRIKKNSIPADKSQEASPLFELVDHVAKAQGIKPFPSKQRQFQAAKQILAAGYTLEEAKVAAERMHADPYWRSRTFDVPALARHINRYAVEREEPFTIDLNALRAQRGANDG